MGTVHLAGQGVCPPLTRILSVSTGRIFSAEQLHVRPPVLLAWLATRSANLEGTIRQWIFDGNLHW